MKLDIGCADTLEPGWTSWDARDGKFAEDITLEDSTVDEIRAVHVLEHIGHEHTHATLIEWHRVLKDQGRLFVAVPDFELIVNNMASSRPDLQCELYIMGGHIDQHDFHKAIFYYSKLSDLLEASGFVDIKKVGAAGANTSHHWCSLNVEAWRRDE